jgi:hypothetical protein
MHIADNSVDNIIYERPWPLMDSLSVREEEATPFHLDAGFGGRD